MLVHTPEEQLRDVRDLRKMVARLSDVLGYFLCLQQVQFISVTVSHQPDTNLKVHLTHPLNFGSNHSTVAFVIVLRTSFIICAALVFFP